MAFVFRPVVTVRKNGRKARRRAAYYWVCYVDPADGAERRHVLKLPSGERVSSREAAEAELRRLLASRERLAAGLTDRYVQAAGVPVRKLLADYLRSMRRRGLSRGHVRQAAFAVQWVCRTAGIETVGRLTQSERIDAALAVLTNARKSPRSVNGYRGFMHGLCGYAVSPARLLATNPVDAVPVRETSGDIRKARRAMTADEARRLLAVALARPLVERATVRRGKHAGQAVAKLRDESRAALERAGRERRAYYATALLSGLRWGEVAALEWRDFDGLETDDPWLRLRADTTKAGRADELPVNRGLAALLKAHRPAFARPTDRVFRSVPTRKTFLADCAAAGVIVRDDRGRSVDRHACRTTFTTWLEAAGVHGRTKSVLTRHAVAKSNLADSVYTDIGLLDLRGAIERLPDVLSDSDVAQLRATGTDDARPDPVVLPVVLNCRESRRTTMNAAGSDSERRDGNRLNCSEKHADSSRCTFGATGFEPATSWSQTRRSSRAELRPVDPIMAGPSHSDKPCAP